MTKLKMRLVNLHPIQYKLNKKTQVLIWNILICIGNMVKDQLIIFSFQIHENILQRVLSKKTIYCYDFVSSCETK